MITIEMEQSERAKDVRACLETLYSTREGTAALDRDFGLSWEFLDKPALEARAALEAEIISKTRKYEPRADISEITWEAGAGGSLTPKVVINIVDD